MANLGQRLTKKIKTTPRIQHVGLKVSVLNSCVHLAYLLFPWSFTETYKYIYTYKKCKQIIILVADPGSLEHPKRGSPCK